ncbi:hypothetical protein DM02DRAFT_658504 [Periconia macrospinosa]|uniref:F-box domain-containing protein n=1 Tax=Periconia macrospinosa TaxID=97972 RepID=A0A2V1DHX6_9PLEO|nr:hypothetical protein DM02DRAFT_658504 [Periconia macrospinosa]
MLEFIRKSSNIFRSTFKLQKTASIENLNDDCILEILEILYLHDRDALCCMSRTSHRFYALAFRLNHRQLKIDFADNRTIHFFRRLRNSSPQVQSLVQTLIIQAPEHWKPTDDPNLGDVLDFVKNLSTLRNLTWRGSIDIPRTMLNDLAKLPVKTVSFVSLANLHMEERWPCSRRSRWDFLSHPLVSHLTVFHWCPTTPRQVHRRFKGQFLSMLKQCEGTLQDLSITPRKLLVGFLPERAMFRQHRFSRLKCFRLNAKCDLFTPAELAIWGRRNAWDGLEQLAIPSTYVPVFLEHTPRLKSLMLTMQLEFQVDRFANWLKDLSTRPTFPSLTNLFVYDKQPAGSNSPDNQWVPVSLFWCMPNLQICQLKSRRGVRTYGPVRGDRDLYTIRHWCPKIRNLYVVAVARNCWPAQMLRELSLLEAHELVTVCFDFHNARSKYRNFYTEGNCLEAYKYMLSCRNSSRLDTKTGFHVRFIAESVTHSADERKLLEYNFKLDSRGGIQTFLSDTRGKFKGTVMEMERRLELKTWRTLSDDALSQAIAEKGPLMQMSFLRETSLYLWDKKEWWAMLAEKRWRQRKAELARRYGEHGTLMEMEMIPRSRNRLAALLSL